MEKITRQVRQYKIHYIRDSKTQKLFAHREDGPAVIDKNGDETWAWFDRLYLDFYSWLNDAEISKELEAKLRLKYG